MKEERQSLLASFFLIQLLQDGSHLLSRTFHSRLFSTAHWAPVSREGLLTWLTPPHLNLFTPQKAHLFTRIYYPLPAFCSLNPAPYFLLTWKPVSYLFTTFLHVILHILQRSLHIGERAKDMKYLIKLANTFRQKSSRRYCPSPNKIHTLSIKVLKL